MRFIKNTFGTLSRALGNSHTRKTSNQNSERFFKPGERSSLANLGCGTRYHADWENYDLYRCDPSVAYLNIAESLPIPNETYSAVYCSHVLEHLSRGTAPRFLGEILRILKPGGVVRLVVPDLGEIARLYVENLSAAASGNPQACFRHEWLTLELLDQMARQFSGGYMGRMLRSNLIKDRDFVEARIGWESEFWFSSAPSLSGGQVYTDDEITNDQILQFRGSGECHLWMYDEYSLGKLLHEVGFVNPRKCSATVSMISNFSSYLLDCNESGAVYKPDSLFMEARKSGNTET